MRVLNKLLIAFCLGVPAICLADIKGAISSSDLGTVGLIDMPTSRMRADGIFSSTYSRQDSIDIYNLSYQALPWLEATFRYSIFDPRRSFNASRFNLRDRSYEVKIRLLEETQYLPELSAGLRDILGTGVFGSEYLVASKSWQNVDFTVGLGWGRLAGNDVLENPLTTLSSSFERRDSDVGFGGEFSFNNYFSGPNLGVFGGLEYSIPSINGKVQLEYNSDNYNTEVNRGVLTRDSRFSYGVVWEPAKDLELGLSWQHGSEIALRVSASVSTNQKQTIKTYAKPWEYILSENGWAEDSVVKNSETIVKREDLSSGDITHFAWYDALHSRAKKRGLALHSAKLNNDGDHLQLEYYNKGHQYQIDGVDHLLTLLNEELGREFKKRPSAKTINSVTLINISNNLRSFAVQSGLRYTNGIYSKSDELPNLTIVTPEKITKPDKATLFQLPYLRFSGDFGLRYSLFDPIAPLKTQLNFNLGAKLQLPDGWTISSNYIFDIVNNFDRSVRTSNSVLPHVRSDINRYQQEGESGIDVLYVEKYDQLSPNLYYRGYAGILEGMFSGIGAEFLYRPEQSRFAFGANINAVRQRDFDRGFGTQDYQVVTGHFSVYWATPYENYDVAVHMGRYLAKDWGATFELTRTFANGWEVGLFATLTDVPFEEFGEGSFDKGFTFRIPFNLFGSSGRRGIGTTIRPIQRDGGARLEGFGTTIWSTLRSTQYDRISEGINSRGQ